jgi:hypothetical protein
VSILLVIKHGAHVCNSTHDCKAGDDVLTEDAGRDATNKDLGVLWVYGSPLRIELIDHNVVPLALLLVTGIGE